jgi:hypothetical protein
MTAVVISDPLVPRNVDDDTYYEFMRIDGQSLRDLKAYALIQPGVRKFNQNQQPFLKTCQILSHCNVLLNLRCGYGDCTKA